MTDVERDGLDLWRRYRAAVEPSSAPNPAEMPEMGLVAAYLEHRLDEDAATPLEAWLAHNPDAICLVDPLDQDASAPLDLIRRARQLVAAPVSVRPAQPMWRPALAWASIAASLLIVSVTGFLAGHDAVDRSESITSIVSSELVYGPGGGDGDGALIERLPSLRASLPWILFALSLTLNVFFLGGYYYKRVLDQHLAGNDQERGRYIAEQLHFTPEQRQNFQAMRQSARDRGRELFRGNRPTIDSLWREIEKPQPDAAALDGYIDHLTAGRAAFQREQMHDLLTFAKTLDESQRVEFLELVRTRLERARDDPA